MLKNFPIFLDEYIDGYIRFAADVFPKFIRIVHSELKKSEGVDEYLLNELIAEFTSILKTAKLLADVEDHVFVVLNKKVNNESIIKNENFNSKEYIEEIVNIISDSLEKLRDIASLGLKVPGSTTYDPIYFDPITLYFESLEIISGNENVATA